MRMCILIFFQVTFDICDTVLLKSNITTVIGRKRFTIFGNKEYAAFYNVPYGNVPARFKPSEPTKNILKGIQDYSTHNCNDYFGIDDCLNLSIFIPVSNIDTKYPVLVLIHPDSNDLGADFLIDQDVILVNVIHRNGILGFLNTEDYFSRGNMGAKDVLLALKWIKHNIERFNGDKDKVTIMGVGTAATAVASMLVSSAANDLFERAIIFDGSALSPADYRTYNFEIAHKLYRKIKRCVDKFDRKELYEVLSKISVNELMYLSRNLYDSTEVRDCQRLINTISCTVESPAKDAFMTKLPIDVYDEGNANKKVEILFGYTSLTSLHRLKGLAVNRKVLKYLNYNFQYLLPFEGNHHEYECKEYKKIRQIIMDFYFLNSTISERSLRRYAKYLSDQVIYPMLRQALLQNATSNKNVYLCRFSFKGSLNVGWQGSVPNLKWMGATLGDEICYLFRCKSANEIYTNLGANERRFIMKYVRLLTNFVKYGDPTPVINDSLLENLHWPSLVSNKKIQAMNFGCKFKMIDIPEEKRLNFWNELKHDYF